jgi:hypothetical protein
VKKLLIFTLSILLLTLSCGKSSVAPQEVNEGLQNFKVVIGEFNHTYSHEKLKDENGNKVKKMVITISDCAILNESELNMLPFFSSGFAYSIFNKMTEAQRKEYNSITIKLKIRNTENTEEYTWAHLSIVEKFDLISYEYWDYFVARDFDNMYSIQDVSVTNELNFGMYRELIQTAYEDKQLLSIEFVGFTFFEDMQRNVVHLWYVLVYEDGITRRHSLFYLVDDNNPYIDGFQL